MKKYEVYCWINDVVVKRCWTFSGALRYKRRQMIPGLLSIQKVTKR